MPISPFVTALFVVITGAVQGILGRQADAILPQGANKFYPLSVCYQGYGFSGLLPEVKRAGERSEWLGTLVIGGARLI